MGENKGDDLKFVSPEMGRRVVSGELNFSSRENEWLHKELRDGTTKEDFLWAISVGLEPKITVGNETFYDSNLGSLRNFDEWMSLNTRQEVTRQRYTAVERLVSNSVGREMSFFEIVQLVVDEEGMMMVYWDDRDATYSRRLGIVSVPWTESRQLEILDEWRSAMWPPLTEKQIWEMVEYERAEEEYEDGYWHNWLRSRGEEMNSESDQDGVESRPTRWRSGKSTADHLEQLRLIEDEETSSMSDENWGEAGYEGENDDGLIDEDRRDWEKLLRLFESDDEHLRQQHGSQIIGEKNLDQRRALRQWVAKQRKQEEKRTQGVEVKPRGRDETSVDSKSWTRRRHVTSLGRSRVSDRTYGGAQRDAGDRRAREKIQWQDEAQEEVSNTLDPYESDKHDKEMPKKPYESARLEGQRAVAKVIADSRLQRRIDEHRRRLQERKMQQQQERKHRSSERVDWYQDMMRKRYEKSQNTRRERRRGK